MTMRISGDNFFGGFISSIVFALCFVGFTFPTGLGIVICLVFGVAIAAYIATRGAKVWALVYLLWSMVTAGAMYWFLANLKFM